LCKEPIITLKRKDQFDYNKLITEKNMKKQITTALALLMAAFNLMTACSSDDKSANNTASETNTVTASETTTAEILPIIEENYNGKSIHILLWQNSLLPATEENGDIINDAVYARNLLIEEKYNVDFSYRVENGSVGDFNEWYNLASSSIMAGDNAFQLVGGYGYRLREFGLDGNWANLLESDSIDFENEWWPSNLIEASNLGGAMYFAVGNIEPDYYDDVYAIFFNKSLASSYGINDLYTQVKDGKWTVDELIKYSSLFSSDINGDGTMTIEDRYGFTVRTSMGVDSFLSSSNIKSCESDENGVPRLLGLSEKYVTLCDKLYEFIKNSGSVYYDSTIFIDSLDLFTNDRAMFFSSNIQNAGILRSMENDFGIIPYPKYDEEQDQYYTYNAIGNVTSYQIPITADAEMVGTILEAMGYYGWRDIRPQYFDIALKVKGVRDEDSSQMLDIIFDNVTYDFTEIYSYSFGDQKAPSMLLRMCIRQNKEIASAYAADLNLYEATMERLLEKLQ